jgi:hypothetical protein
LDENFETISGYTEELMKLKQIFGHPGKIMNKILILKLNPTNFKFIIMITKLTLNFLQTTSFGNYS